MLIRRHCPLDIKYFIDLAKHFLYHRTKQQKKENDFVFIYGRIIMGFVYLSRLVREMRRRRRLNCFGRPYLFLSNPRFFHEL